MVAPDNDCGNTDLMLVRPAWGSPGTARGAEPKLKPGLGGMGGATANASRVRMRPLLRAALMGMLKSAHAVACGDAGVLSLHGLCNPHTPKRRIAHLRPAQRTLVMCVLERL